MSSRNTREGSAAVDGVGRRMARWTLRVVAVLAAASAVAFVLHAREARRRGVARVAARAGLPVPVRTATVREETITEVAGGPGVTRPTREVDLSLLSLRLGRDRLESYRVIKLHVAMGSAVRRGDPILEVESRIRESQVRARQALYDAARAELAHLVSQLRTTQRVRELALESVNADVAFAEAAIKWRDVDHVRVSRLFTDSTATPTELGEARNDLAQAHFHLAQAHAARQRARDDVANGADIDAAQLATVRATVADADRALESAKVELEQCRVVSPVEGVVRSVAVEESEVVAGGMPLVTVYQLDPVLFIAEMPQERVDLIRTGAEAEVTLDAFPRESFRGTIVRVSPQVNQATRAFDVVIEIPNPASRLKAGLSGHARVRVTRSGTTVPAAAVVERGRQAMGFVVEAGRAHLRPIVVGRRVGIDRFEVEHGLTPGTSVVIHGLRYLRDGDRVNSHWREWALRPPAPGEGAGSN